MTLRFAIDERSFDLAALSAVEVAAAIRALLDTMEALVEARHGICYDRDLVFQPIWNGLSFWELFNRNDVPLFIPDMEKAAAQFSSLIHWDETGPPQPTILGVHVAGGPVETTGTLAWTHAQSQKKLLSAACISSASKRQMGRHSVTLTGGSTAEVWFIDTLERSREYFRDLIALHAQTPQDVATLCPHAFPSLDFVVGSFSGIKTMSRPLPQIAPDLVRHLAALSDEGATIFSGPWLNAPAQFGALGVNISDENGKTKQNSVARKERTAKFNGTLYEFWWHTKIEPDRDRIHIYPDLVSSGGRLVIGIFCRHLTT